jgi:hypothetical protein
LRFLCVDIDEPVLNGIPHARIMNMKFHLQRETSIELIAMFVLHRLDQLEATARKRGSSESLVA